MAADSGIYSAVASAGSGLLGSLISLFNQNSANDTNFNIHQMDNEYNWKMVQDARKWALEDRAHEEEYNDPRNSLKRLLAAYKQQGLNPALMMSQGVNGLVQPSNTSAPPVASAASPIPMQAANLSGLGLIGGQVADSLLKDRELDIKEKDVDSQMSERRQNILESKERIKNFEKERTKIVAEAENIRSNTARNYVQNALDTLQTLADFDYKVSMTRLNEKEYEYYDRMAQQTLKKLRAETQNLLANKHMLEKQAGLLQAQYDSLRKSDARAAIEFAAQYGSTKEEIMRNMKNRLETFNSELLRAYKTSLVTRRSGYVGMATHLGLIGNMFSAIPAAFYHGFK